MNKILIPAFVAVLASPAFAFTQLGDNAELFLTGDVSIKHDSNIFLSDANAKSDTIISLAPGIAIPFGQGSTMQGELTITEEFQMFASRDELNDELLNARFTSNYDDGLIQADSTVSYAQINQNNQSTAGLGTISRRDVAHAGVTVEYAATALTAFSAGLNWDDTNYKSSALTDWEYFEVPLKVYYELSPQVDLSAGFRYKDNNLSAAGADTNEYFYSVGARGDLLPKLTGEFSIGYNVLDRDTGGSKSGLGLDSNFSYAATEKTSLTFGLSSAYSYSAAGAAQDVWRINGGVRIMAQEDLTLNGSISYSETDYIVSGRNEELFTIGAGAEYLVNAFLTVRGSIDHSSNAVNRANSDYKDTIFKVSAGIRY